MKTLCVMLVAAEASGDNIGASLARALKARLGEGVRFVGVGGPRMVEAGVASAFDISDLSILGWAEGLMAYRRVVRRADEVAAVAAAEKPDAAVLIDSWGFTLRVAHRLRKLDRALPIIKYVAPQVWASRPRRARTLAHAVDHLLSIHRFDTPYFEAEGLAVTYVGNIALTADFSAAHADRLRAAIGADADAPLVLVLLGSRPSEVARLGPVFGDALQRLKVQRPDLRIVVSAAGGVAAQVKAMMATWMFAADLIEDDDSKADAMAAATVALACSGTVTTELALAGCPMVVGYRLSPITHSALKWLIRTPWVTLLNVAARAFVVPEYIQGRCTGPALAAALQARLDDPALRRRQIEAQREAVALMGTPDGDPSEKAADVVIRLAAQPRLSTGT